MDSLPFCQRSIWEWRQLVNVVLFTSFPQQTGKGIIWTVCAPSQHRSTPCLHKQSYMQLNLLASKCTSTQLVATKPASAEERLLPSPPLCVRRADVSCAVIFWVTAGWTKPWCLPLLIGDGWWRNKDTTTTKRLEKLYSYGESISFLSLSSRAPTALLASVS